MKSSDVFSSKYLRVDDLRGRDVTVTIDHVEVENMPNGGKKPAVYFRNTEKALICNKTNFNTIVQTTGEDDTENWGGRQITLYPSETEFQGQMVDCIRVRRKKFQNYEEPSKPPAGFRQAEGTPDDELVPF